MTDSHYMTDSRNSDLAKIHIARKDLRLDDESYRAVIHDIGGAESGSARDLTELGRRKVIGHFKAKGWKPKGPRRPGKQRNPSGTASSDQVKLIRHIWICLAQADVVKAKDETGLRKWIQSTTRRYHPHKAGYSAPEFLPFNVAIRVTEQLKQWAKRCGVEWR